MGFLAQEVLAAGLDTVVDANDQDNLKLRETSLIPVLTKALQEAHALIKDLTARVEAMERK